jgi:tetrapyrrole methylase family protein / MazG family protein
MAPVPITPDPEKMKSSFIELYNIIAHLRGPDGCPWDREQTPESMRANLVEEAYECVEAIDDKDMPHLREELGDLFLILILIARMNEETGAFSLEEAFRDISAKLIRRHPHVFDARTDASIPEILKNWDYIKEHVEGKKKKPGVLSDLNHALPPLEKSFQLQKKAAKVCFDWPSAAPVFAKLAEETGELKEALKQGERTDIEDEVGDLLFTLVNLARHLKVDPSLALERTNRKFMRRFSRMEEIMRDKNISFPQCSLADLDALWEQVKKEARDSGA